MSWHRLVRRLSLLPAAALATLLAVGTGGAAAQSDSHGVMPHGDADRGKLIVERWCVSCHGTATQRDDRVPSLPALATNPKSEAFIRAFLMMPHKPMPPLELSSQQIEDIIAYLDTVHS